MSLPLTRNTCSQPDPSHEPYFAAVAAILADGRKVPFRLGEALMLIENAAAPANQERLDAKGYLNADFQDIFLRYVSRSELKSLKDEWSAEDKPGSADGQPVEEGQAA
jgi:hypothetical protein